jgi:DNA-binding NtrC family response regulator
MSKLLLVDDDVQLRTVLAAYLRRAGLEVLEAGNCKDARSLQARERPDVTVVDYELPDGTAFDVLNSMQERDAGEAAIVLTGLGTIDLAVRAIKSGAEHFLTKPVDVESLGLLVQRTLDVQRGRRQQTAARASVRGSRDPFIGTSTRIQELKELAHAVVDSDAPVLILGETGSGKGVLAHWLHDNGSRSNEPFVDMNCAAFSKELVASELFGHQRGAFTGAASNKPGLVEVAHKGTLFLDEIGDLDLDVQPKLLKVLEDRSFRRLGEVTSRSSDVRLIAATHRDLAQLVLENRFRDDLRFRINTITLELPPLRDRPEDIPEIAEVVLSSLAARSGRQVELDKGAAHMLSSYPWPGNIRELRNVLERALVFCKHSVIDRNALRFDRVLEPASADEAGPNTLDEAEKHHIMNVLRRMSGRVDDAARILDVSRSALYAKLKKHGIKANA